MRILIFYPVFLNSTEASGSFQGKHVTAFIIVVENDTSSYIRADVIKGVEIDTKLVDKNVTYFNGLN